MSRTTTNTEDLELPATVSTQTTKTLLDRVLAKETDIELTRDEWNALPEDVYENFQKRDLVLRSPGIPRWGSKPRYFLVAWATGEGDRTYLEIKVARKAPVQNRTLRTFTLYKKSYDGLDWTGDYATYDTTTLGTCQATSIQGAWAAFRRQFGPLTTESQVSYRVY